jgi:hypothetical protein
MAADVSGLGPKGPEGDISTAPRTQLDAEASVRIAKGLTGIVYLPRLPRTGSLLAKSSHRGQGGGGALGTPAGRVLVLAGHDTNISHISGLLQPIPEAEDVA